MSFYTDFRGDYGFRAGLRRGPRFSPEAGDRPILVLDRVYKSYRLGVPVLRGVSLTVARGEFVFVTGPSGAGKSTLLRLLYREELADEGAVRFLGRDLSDVTPESLPLLRRNIGVVFQDFRVVPDWTAFENVAVALRVLHLPDRLIRVRVGEALERVGLSDSADTRVIALSGGEQQRVAVARAIVAEPAMLLADEPTGNLDPQLAADILGLFEEIHGTGTTVIFATHDRTLLEVTPRRVVVLDDGKAHEFSDGFTQAVAS